jgi:hypothetical protein
MELDQLEKDLLEVFERHGVPLALILIRKGHSLLYKGYSVTEYDRAALGVMNEVLQVSMAAFQPLISNAALRAVSENN